ncbi:MAG TPA: hypothetical protein DCS11_03495 [Syntrophus sp. (in: bacteria)]|nr:hypothetical protein [Syntrophus sp. (in: bacteria)]
MGTGILLVILLLGCADSTSRAVNYFEDRAVYKAVCHYLDAEVNRDHRGVYESLAPSSPYCKNNSYEMYLSQAASAPAIASYKIIKISDIRMNGDRQRYPKIDKFARVEVELVLVLNEDGQTTEVNFAFPFVKEGGKWYKG